MAKCHLLSVKGHYHVARTTYTPRVYHLQALELPVQAQQEKRHRQQPQALRVPKVLQTLQSKDSTPRNKVVFKTAERRFLKY